MNLHDDLSVYCDACLASVAEVFAAVEATIGTLHELRLSLNKLLSISRNLSIQGV